jgi:hypothetical protein
MKQAIAILFLLFSVPVLRFGWGFVWSAVKLRSGQPFYAGAVGDYTTYGAVWTGMGLLILLTSAAVLLRKDSKGGWLVLPLLLLLLVAVALPSIIPPGFRGQLAGQNVQWRMETAARQLEEWGREHRQLPADEGELRGALAPKETAAEKAPDPNSRFLRGGQPVAYRFVLVPNARAPHRPQPAGDQPAMVYCAISPDRQRFWLTATALPDDVSSEVTMLEHDGELVLLTGTVPAPEPAPAAPEKDARKKVPAAK